MGEPNELFDENEENELETEEFVVDLDAESESPNEFSEIIANSTAFLYMTEDYENDRISKVDIIQALHILRDSIESYLTSQDMKEDGQEQEQLKNSDKLLLGNQIN